MRQSETEDSAPKSRSSNQKRSHHLLSTQRQNPRQTSLKRRFSAQHSTLAPIEQLITSYTSPQSPRVVLYPRIPLSPAIFMTSNSHTYFSNHSQTRLLANNNNSHYNSNNGNSNHSSSANTTSSSTTTASSALNQPGSGFGASKDSHSRSQPGSLSRSKHFSTTVGGDKEKDKIASLGGDRLGGGRGDSVKTVHPLRST